MDGATIISTIVTSLKDFVVGLGQGLVSAFQNVFMNATTAEGVTTYSGINPLGIFLLTLIGLGFGVMLVRWIVGLVQRHRS